MNYRHFFILSLLLLGVVFSCKKDKIFETTAADDDNSHETLHTLGEGEVGRVYNNLDDLSDLKSKLLVELQSIQPDASAYESLLNGSVIESDNPTSGGKIYMIYWEAFGGSFYKMYVEADQNGDLTNAGVFEFDLDEDFLRSYYNKETTIPYLRGKVRTMTPQCFFDKRNGEIGNGVDACIDPCMEIVFGSTDPPNSGGPSTGQPGGDDLPSELPTLPEGCDWEISFVTCGCNPHHAGGYINPDCVCQLPDIYFWTIVCEFTDETIEDRSGDEFWDCVDLLNNFGLITDHDLYLMRLEDCNGYLDPYDYGPDNPAGTHPDYEFCEQWMNYKDECITGQEFKDSKQEWADLLWKNPEAYECLITAEGGCDNGNDLVENHSIYINSVYALPCLTAKEKCNLVANADPNGILLMEELHAEIGFDDEELCFLLDDNPDVIDEIDNFIETAENNPDPSVHVMALQYVKTMVEIQSNSSGELSNIEFNDLLDAFTSFSTSNDPDDFVETLIENGVDPLGLSTKNALLNNSNPNSPPPTISPVEDLDRDAIWAIAGPIKQKLLDDYPTKTATINAQFPCVMGSAFEEAVLGSLGLPKNNASYNGKIPDGVYWFSAFDMETNNIVNQPNFVEVKCHLANGPFDYSNNPSQLDGYLDFIESNTYMGSTTIGTHSLYLIVPAQVSIAQNIIDDCTDRNIPLYVSHAELGNGEADKFKVTEASIPNISLLNRTDHYFDYLPDAVWEASLVHHRESFYLDFSYSTFDIQKHADNYENSVLIGNSNPECPD